MDISPQSLGTNKIKPNLFKNIPRKFVLVGIVFIVGLIFLIVWQWYGGGYQRDAIRVSQSQSLVGVLQNYQNQYANLPQGSAWLDLQNVDSGLQNLQDPQAPAKFYVYCPTTNGYLVAVNLERGIAAYPSKNLASGVALNGCLTSTGVKVQSLSCSIANSQGEINGAAGNVWCVGNL